MTFTAPTRMSDRELLVETRRVVDVDRRTTAELLALLAEVDARKLYRGEGYSSLFTYCTHVLRLSEPAAYSRIAAARAAQQLPAILTRLVDGDVTLTTITLLASHLTEDNHEALLDSARHKSKREVERLVAALDPQPDIRASIRRQPASIRAPMQLLTDVGAPTGVAAQSSPESVAPAVSTRPPVASTTAAVALRRPPKRALVAPLSPTRYLVKVTVSQETHDKLQRARGLLRHTVPNGDPAEIIDRALTVLIAQLEKTKHGATTRPRASTANASAGRHIPAASSAPFGRATQAAAPSPGVRADAPTPRCWSSIM